MTSTVTRSTTAFLVDVSVEQLSVVVGLWVLAVLLTVLVERELVSAAGLWSPSARLLDVVAASLLIVFVVVVFARFVSLA